MYGRSSMYTTLHLDLWRRQSRIRCNTDRGQSIRLTLQVASVSKSEQQFCGSESRLPNRNCRYADIVQLFFQPARQNCPSRIVCIRDPFYLFRALFLDNACQFDIGKG